MNAQNSEPVKADADIRPGYGFYLRRSRWAVFLGLVSLIVFTTTQYLSFRFLGDETVLTPWAAKASVMLNLAAIVAVALYYVLNFVIAPRTGCDRERLFRITIHGVSIVILVITLGHLHIAGSATSILPMQFLSVCMVVAWLIGLKESWWYFLAGIAGWGAIMLLEKWGLLTYLPLHPDHARIPKDIFLESRYVGMIFTLFAFNAVFILGMMNYYAHQLHSTNANLERSRREIERGYNQLRQLEALRDSLTHMIVHDLRSPLAGVQLNLQAAKLRLEPGHAALARIDKSIAGIGSQLELINCLLDVNKFEAGHMTIAARESDLRDAIRRGVELLGALAEDRRISIDDADAPPPFAFDPDLIARVVANLVGNAVKFTPRGGEIRIALRAGDGIARVCVADDGPGIAPSDQKKIFEKFGQAELRGQMKGASTGLGLAFCRLAIEAHRGRIWVDSEVGRGSTFSFELPIGPGRATDGVGGSA